MNSILNILEEWQILASFIYLKHLANQTPNVVNIQVVKKKVPPYLQD